MKAIDFLTFAKTLHNSHMEAARRSSVSRAYFALYHHVKERFNSSGIQVTKDPAEHQKMARYLIGTEIYDAKEVGQSLSDLRESRNDADYKLQDKRFDSITCAFECAKAESAINMLNKLDVDKLKQSLIIYGKKINEIS